MSSRVQTMIQMATKPEKASGIMRHRMRQGSARGRGPLTREHSPGGAISTPRTACVSAVFHPASCDHAACTFTLTCRQSCAPRRSRRAARDASACRAWPVRCSSPASTASCYRPEEPAATSSSSPSVAQSTSSCTGAAPAVSVVTCVRSVCTVCSVPARELASQFASMPVQSLP